MSNLNIPVRNIYYLLCYAWNVLEQSDHILVGSEKFDNIYNLFARIYINGSSNLIKRGLSRNYIREHEEVSTLKGKVEIADSIKKQTLRNGRMVCQYDNFSANIKLNQIIKATINILLKSPQLDQELKKKLTKLRLYFYGIQDIQLSKEIFNSPRYNRNNYHYRMLVNISELIYHGMITNESGNETLFSNFIRDRQMANLYEKFVLNFYRKHLDSSVYQVYSPKLQWDLDIDASEDDLSLLPEMRTDIVVENKVTETQLIIDTKYYAETLVTSNWTDSEKVRTGHLYQIFAYVNNSDFLGNIKGVLLYPTITKEINADYSIGGNGIHIRTLNLNTDWNVIEKRLLSLVGNER
ncbi:5-methylcytosine-specific restriction endonuclease system specificity protein McrC [Cytobacillus gottheilii]|uniref:5-methylcytosine-specific restriction endonuclease system specificity protein McrC n=1 Tax=Cytobacillus gottheilii TaxID=859144 RepID=UPI0024958A0B|nr:5-methylcytosine-specific restriction endonuclease system specificity protein McrC [Cytobacillus gottheilii]